MENTRRLNVMNNMTIDHQYPNTVIKPSIEGFFASSEIIPDNHRNFYNLELLSQMICDLLKQEAQSNVIYTEFRFNVLHWLNAGVSFEDATQVIHNSMQVGLREFHILSGCVLCFTRNADIEEIESIIESLTNHKPHCIVGIDIAGNEKKYPNLTTFEGALKQISAMGLGITIHAGEFGHSDNIWHAIEECGATRIGHGIAAVNDSSLLDNLAKKRIMLDISLTSNVVMDVVDSFETHPIRLFVDRGVPVSINTDNPIFLSTDMNREFRIAIAKCGLTTEDLHTVTNNSIIHSFASKKVKKLLFSAANNRF